MAETSKSPIRPTDDEARALAQTLLKTSTICSIGVFEPKTRAPMVTRISFGLDASGRPVSLVSALSGHTSALRADPTCSLLVGEPSERGDPLNSPRVTLMATASFVERSDPAYEVMAEHYLKTHRKAKLYIGFGDFSFAVFDVNRAYLNGGFGKAFHLTPQDLGLTSE